MAEANRESPLPQAAAAGASIELGRPQPRPRSETRIDDCALRYYRPFVVTITCKIPDDLNDRLEAEASRAMLPKSALVREALNRSFKRPRQPPKTAAFDRVRDLCGIIKDGPADMSTNPKYMDGFGK